MPISSIHINASTCIRLPCSLVLCMESGSSWHTYLYRYINGASPKKIFYSFTILLKTEQTSIRDEDWRHILRHSIIKFISHKESHHNDVPNENLRYIVYIHKYPYMFLVMLWIKQSRNNVQSERYMFIP